MSLLNIVQKLWLSSSVSGPHPQHGYFCAHWINPSPFKDTPLIHPHRHRLSIHRGRNGSTLSRARAPPPLFHLLRSLILHKLSLWQDNKPYLPSMSSLQRTTDAIHLCKRPRGIVATPLRAQQRYYDNQCYFTSSVVAAIWEKLGWANHILSMRATSSHSRPYLHWFALITRRENYRVEDDGDKHFQMAKRGFPGCASCGGLKASVMCNQNCARVWVHVHIFLCCTDHRYWLPI